MQGWKGQINERSSRQSSRYNEMDVDIRWDRQFQMSWVPLSNIQMIVLVQVSKLHLKFFQMMVGGGGRPQNDVGLLLDAEIILSWYAHRHLCLSPLCNLLDFAAIHSKASKCTILPCSFLALSSLEVEVEVASIQFHFSILLLEYVISPPWPKNCRQGRIGSVKSNPSL